MIRIWGQPLDALGLQRLASPAQGDLETFPHIVYDRVNVATGDTQTTFFTTAPAAGINLTNMELAGQFPAPQWFQPFGIMITPMAAGPSNAALAAPGTNQPGIQNDFDLIAKTGLAVVSLSIASKLYGPWPILACHGTGGAMGFFSGPAAASAAQQVQNGPADGGFGPQGEIVIPPTVGWFVRLNYNAPLAALSVSPQRLEAAIVGRIYRAPR